MLTRFLQQHGWWAVAFSVGMTLFIGFRPWSSEGPLLTSPLQWVVTFVALLLSQLGLSAVVDPEVGAKLRERLERRQAQHKTRRELLERKDEEARRRLREAWRELRGERRTKP